MVEDKPLDRFVLLTSCPRCKETREHSLRFFDSCNDRVCAISYGHFHRVCLVCRAFWCEKPEEHSIETDPKYN